MTQKLTLLSQEVEDFVLEILIDADTTFHELHRLILDACHYNDTRSHSFLICDEDWRVRNVIRQTDTGSVGADEDLYLMSETALSDFLEEEGQRLAYIFDPEGKRYFLLELTENIFGHPQPEPRVARRHGAAPAQQLTEDEPAPKQEPQTESTEDFYDSDEFDESEIDQEGFEISEQ